GVPGRFRDRASCQRRRGHHHLQLRWIEQAQDQDRRGGFHRQQFHAGRAGGGGRGRVSGGRGGGVGGGRRAPGKKERGGKKGEGLGKEGVACNPPPGGNFASQSTKRRA